VQVVFDHFDTQATFELSEASFGMSQPDQRAQKLFRDPVALRALEKIVVGLRQDGFLVDDPRPGKACPAICSYLLKDRRINIMLGIDGRDEGHLNCFIWTFCGQPFIYTLLRRDPLASPHLAEKWMQLCAAIDKQLKETLSASSVKWDRLHYRPRGSLKIY
jgi:hypothetical protein